MGLRETCGMTALLGRIVRVEQLAHTVRMHRRVPGCGEQSPRPDLGQVGEQFGCGRAIAGSNARECFEQRTIGEMIHSTFGGRVSSRGQSPELGADAL